ncbi:MAG: hypothetical protein KQJ78_13665 [Deltaproteobacteria bacterium]|nr:hypothetical protein [Deltaproteobacteria bacterium]
MKKFVVIALAVAALTLGGRAVQNAEAGGHGALPWLIGATVGLTIGAIAAAAACPPAPVYYAPPPVYYAPPPVVYPGYGVYVPAPGYYRAPRYYAPPYRGGYRPYYPPRGPYRGGPQG